MTQAVNNSENTQDQLTWSAFPMKESPVKGVLFWTILPLTVWMVYWNVGSILLTVIAALLLLGSLTSFYLPTQYTLDSKCASFKRGYTRRSIEWSRVRSVIDEKGGLFLSPYPLKSRLENFRGLFLPYRDNRDEMLDFVKRFSPVDIGSHKISSTGKKKDSGVITKGEN